MVNTSFLRESGRGCVLRCVYCKCFHLRTYNTYINVRVLKRPWRVLCGHVWYGREKSNLWIRFFFFFLAGLFQNPLRLIKCC